MEGYSFKLTLKKAGTEALMVCGAALAVALGNVLMNPQSVGLELPEGIALWAVPVLAALGRGLLNMAKHLGK